MSVGMMPPSAPALCLQASLPCTPRCCSVAEATPATATFSAKAPGVLAGVWVAHAVFARVDPAVTLAWALTDGQQVQPGQVIGQANGSAR